MRRLLLLAALSVVSVAQALPYVQPGDSLDLSFTALDALAAVERAYVCRENDGRAVRTKVLRLLHDYDVRTRGTGKLTRLSKDLLKGIPLDGEHGEDPAHWVFARLKRFAGELYDHPEQAMSGEVMLAKIRRRSPGLRDFRSDVPEAVRAYDRLMELSREDLSHAVRPGGVGGSPFWNGFSKQFAYPPSFAFAPDASFAKYRFVVLDDRHDRHVFEADAPTALLSPVWPEIPMGFATVFCYGLDAAGHEARLVGERRFWRAATFDPAAYRPAKRSFEDAHRLAVEGLLEGEDIRYLEAHGKPDVAGGSNFASYPSKMQSAVIMTMVEALGRMPERRERLLKIARCSADYLLTTREPEGAPLEGFTATYVGEGQMAAAYGGQHMLVYPADAGSAFLSLYGATGERKYLAAAERIAKTYLRLQGEDGTWYLKMNAADGTPVAKNRLVPTSVIAFLESLYAATGEAKYRAAADRAFGCIDGGPLKTWMWEGQFEDIPPVAERYRNLTKHNACDTAIYLLKRFPNDKRRRTEARDILRYAEDQFVCWKAPCRRDNAGAWTAEYQFHVWHTPVALEQYFCYNPIDASSSKLIRTYLAMYAAEGNPLDLAKARALGAAMVNEQEDSGRIRTYFVPEPQDKGDPDAGTTALPLGGDWFNCAASDVDALGALAATGG